MIPILILAAGQSTRMRGRDKLLEEIDNETLLRRITRRALATKHPVYVALPPRPHARYDEIADLPATPVTIKDAARGISQSLKQGLAQLRSPADAVLILLADLPDIDTNHLQHVLAARKAHPSALVWRGSSEDGTAGHPVLIDAQLFPEIDALEGDSGAHPVIKRAGSQVFLVREVGDAAITDLDTPEAWQDWLQRQLYSR